MQRRDLLKWSFGTLVATTLPRWAYAGSILSAAQSFLDKNTSGQIKTMDRQQWRVLIAVQSHLLPSEADSPGAQDINAANYLHNVLVDPKFDAADRIFVKTGIGEIQRLARQQQEDGFIELQPEVQEKVLRQYEKTSQGSRWLNMILEYLMEALLTDPVYGGNPKGIGWQWLGHTPGSPRPPKHKRYFLL